MIKITTCPTCGSKRIKRVCRDVIRQFQGKPYTVPGLEFHECPDCGENVYDPDAVRKVKEHSPAYAKAHAGK